MIQHHIILQMPVIFAIWCDVESYCKCNVHSLNTLEIQKSTSWWPQDGRAVIVVPLHRSFREISSCRFFLMVPPCWNILQMDKSQLASQLASVNKSQLASVHQSITSFQTPNWYHLTPNSLFPTPLEANCQIFQSRPKIHSAFHECTKIAFWNHH